MTSRLRFQIKEEEEEEKKAWQGGMVELLRSRTAKKAMRLIGLTAADGFLEFEFPIHSYHLDTILNFCKILLLL
jgi:hypothetical protein